MSGAENWGFGLKIAGIPKEGRDRRVLKAAKLFELEDYLDRKPKALCRQVTLMQVLNH